jgi:hypothetical protein
VAEGAGLENRYTRKGIVGSNPTLSAMTGLLFLLQVPGPVDCSLTGLCGLRTAVAAIPSGLMFTALGLVAGGVIGYLAARRRSRTG